MDRRVLGSQAFEMYGRKSDCKDHGIRWLLLGVTDALEKDKEDTDN